MSNIPADLKYVASHEWLRLEADGTVTVGITEHAQELLGDIVFVELPEVGANLAAEEQAGVVESVKAASDVYAPIAGEVVEINPQNYRQPTGSSNAHHIRLHLFPMLPQAWRPRPCRQCRYAPIQHLLARSVEEIGLR